MQVQLSDNQVYEFPEDATPEEIQKFDYQQQSAKVQGEDWLAKRFAPQGGTVRAESPLIGAEQSFFKLPATLARMGSTLMEYGGPDPYASPEPVSETELRQMRKTPAEHIESIKQSPLFEFSKRQEKLAEEVAPLNEAERNDWLVKAAQTPVELAPLIVSGPFAPATIGLQSFSEHLVNDYDRAKAGGKSDDEAAGEAMNKALLSGGIQAAIFAVLPPPLRKLGDKYLVDKFGEKASRFIAGRVAAAGEMAPIMGASHAAEQAIEGQPVTEGLPGALLGGALFGLASPRGPSHAEQEMMGPPAWLHRPDQQALGLTLGQGEPGAETELVRTSPHVLEPHRPPTVLLSSRMPGEGPSQPYVPPEPGPMSPLPGYEPPGPETSGRPIGSRPRIRISLPPQQQQTEREQNAPPIGIQPQGNEPELPRISPGENVQPNPPEVRQEAGGPPSGGGGAVGSGQVEPKAPDKAGRRILIKAIQESPADYQKRIDHFRKTGEVLQPIEPTPDKAAEEKPKSSTQLTLPTVAAQPFIEFAKSIPDSEVYHKADETGKEDYGIETEPHITALFGLTEHTPEPVDKAIADHGPITVKLGKLSVFENPEYDVLKVDVSGPELHALNKKLRELPNEQSFDDYKPHLTIAYLKKGEGKKYVGDERFNGHEITFDSLTFSPPKEVRAEIGKPELPLSKPTQPEPVKVDPEEPTTTIFDPNAVSIIDFPIADIKQSKDVPNFKKGASPETGVVAGEQLGGKFERFPIRPITLWKRLNGDVEIITGRHRLDLANRSGEKTIPAQVVDESKGYTRDMALTLDAESNIKDGQGTVEDYAHYFKNSPQLTEELARSRGLLSRAKGKAGWNLGRNATDDLFALWQNGKVTEDQAVTIAREAPNDPALQGVGAKQAIKGRSPAELVSEMQAARVLTAGVKADQLDLWGADDSAIQQMEKMGALVRSKQREISEQISAISGASKRPDIAKKLGVNIDDPAAVSAKLQELHFEKSRWDRWELDPSLVQQLKDESSGKPKEAPKPVEPPKVEQKKEPWQMTAAEWKTHEQRGTWSDFSDAPLTEQRAKESAAYAAIKTAEEARKKLGQMESIRKVMTDRSGALKRNQGRRDADKATDEARSQFSRESLKTSAMQTHEAFIKRALQRGDAVPDEVLSDYPDLKKPEPKPEGHHVAVYGGKEVPIDYVDDPKREFKVAAQRVRDNLKAGEKGYVRTPTGEIFEISTESKVAKPVDKIPEPAKETAESIRKKLNRGYYEDADGATWKVQQEEPGRFYTEKTLNGVKTVEGDGFSTIEQAQDSIIEQVTGKAIEEKSKSKDPFHILESSDVTDEQISNALAEITNIPGEHLIPGYQNNLFIATLRADSGQIRNLHERGVKPNAAVKLDNNPGYFVERIELSGTPENPFTKLEIVLRDQSGSTVGRPITDLRRVTADEPGGPGEKPTLKLEEPETVEQQKAREAREQAQAAEKKAKEKLAEEAAKPLKGTAGDLGQGDLLNAPEDLFAPPAQKPTVEKPKIISDERAAELKKKIADRFKNIKRSDIGSGRPLMPFDDPKLYSELIQLGAHYIETGYHKFADWAAKMREDWGDVIEKYLKNIYETAKITIESPGSESVAGRGPGLQPGLRPPNDRIVIARAQHTPHADESILKPEIAQHLDPHQKQGAAAALHSLEKRGGFLNADGTGAGKTRQAIAVADHYAVQGRKVLIITKAETIKQDWKKNIYGGSYAFDSNVMGVKIRLARDGKVNPGEIGITTYENLDSVRKNTDKNTVLIFDEAHALKNDSQRAKHATKAVAQADKVMFMSATPADKPEHIYYLAPIGVMEGKTVQQQLKDLGMQLVNIEKMVKNDVTGKMERRMVTFWAEDQRVSDQQRHERFSALFDRLTQKGSAIKREVSMDGVHVQVLEIPLPPEAHETMGSILDFFGAKHIDDLQGLKKAIVLGHQRRQQEPFKIAPAVMLTKREIDAGRQVVIFVQRVNESEVGKWVKNPITQERWRETLMSSEGTAKTIVEALHEAGIHDIAEIHGNAEQSSLDAMADFQSGKKRVVVATIESGGTGINLDDTVGNRPRTMIVVTAPFDAVGNVQAAGRIWRLKTLSGSNMFYLFGDTDVDKWNAGIIGDKMSMLGAVVEGQVRRLNVADPDLVSTDDFHGEVKPGKQEAPAPEVASQVPQLDWKPFKTKAGKDKFLAPATKEFWQWYNENGKGQNPLGLRPSKYEGKWQVWADKIPTAPEGGTFKEGAEKIAGALENIKVDPGTLGTFGLIPDTWNRAVSIVQAAIRAGGSVADAVEAGIKYIRDNFKGKWDEEGARRALASGSMPGETRQRNRQVMGVRQGPLQEIESIIQQRAAIQEHFFNGNSEVSEANTRNAWDIARELSGQNRGQGTQTISDIVRDAAGIESADMAPALALVELRNYALKMVRDGDRSLMDFLVKSRIGVIDPTQALDPTQVARALRALAVSRSPFWDNVIRITQERELAAGRELGVGEELFHKLMDTVENLNPDDIRGEIERQPRTDWNLPAETDDPLLQIISRLPLPQTPAEVRFKAKEPLADRIMAQFPLMNFREKFRGAGGKQLLNSWLDLLRVSPIEDPALAEATALFRSELAQILREKLTDLGFDMTKEKVPLSDHAKLAKILGLGEEKQGIAAKADKMVTEELEARRAKELKAAEGGDPEIKERIDEKYSQLQDLWNEASAGLLETDASQRLLSRMVKGELREQKIRLNDALASGRNLSELRSEIVDALLRKTQEAATNKLDLENVRKGFESAFDDAVEKAKDRIKMNEARKAERKVARDREANDAERTARAITHQLQLKHGAEWLKPELRNEVRRIVTEFLTPDDSGRLSANALAEGGFTEELIQRLKEAGVEPRTASDLAQSVWTEAYTRFANRRARQINRVGERGGTLGPLMDELMHEPYLAQHNPKWRQTVAERWFMAKGLSREQAEAAAKNFSKQFEEAMLQAAEKAARRLLEGKTEAESINDVVRAIRLGLTDPNKHWSDIIAERTGFRPLTAEQQATVARLELERNNPALSPAEVASVNERMMAVFRHAGERTGQKLQRLGESFVNSLLSGIRTLTIQMEPVIMTLRDFPIAALSDPKNAVNMLSSMYKGYRDNFTRAFKYAWQHDAYGFHLSEIDRTHNALKTWWEDLEKEYAAAKNPAQKAWVRARQLYAAQQYVSRLLNSIDNSMMAATQPWKLAYYSSLAFKEAGISTARIGDLIDAVTRGRQAAYEEAIASGAEPDAANQRADWAMRQLVSDFVNNATGSDTLGAKVVASAENDIYSMVGRRGQGIKEMDEGLLSKPMNAFMEWISNLRGRGGGSAIASTALFGFVNIPFRTARYWSQFSPYGLLRSGIHAYRTNKGLDTFWKQSYGTELQAKARLREAIAGTVALGLATAWGAANSTADDKAGEENAGLYITGAGPTNKVLKDAWAKAGWKQYSLNFIIGGHKVAVPLTRVGEAIMYPFMLAAAIDDAKWKAKEAAAAGRPVPNPVGNYLGTLIGEYFSMSGQRGIFQGISQMQEMTKGGTPVLKALAKEIGTVASGLLMPFKQLAASVSDMIVGPLDYSSASSIVANNFPIVGLPFQNRQVNRFGDPMYDRSWYGKIARTGIPIAFQVSKTPENETLYNDILLQKGVAPPSLSRSTLETRYGPLTNAEFAQFSQISGDILKKATLANAAGLKSASPEEVNKFLDSTAKQANDQAEAQMQLTRVKPSTRAAALGTGGATGSNLPSDRVSVSEPAPRATGGGGGSLGPPSLGGSRRISAPRLGLGSIGGARLGGRRPRLVSGRLSARGRGRRRIRIGRPRSRRIRIGRQRIRV